MRRHPLEPEVSTGEESDSEIRHVRNRFWIALALTAPVVAIAICHGKAGRGDGPVSKSLRVEVPDLTRYAQRHGDFFDRDVVERIIDGRHVIGAHGSRTMPVWGEDLSKAQLGDPDAERATRIEITRLADYVWQLQRPSTSIPRAVR